jgi:hypothetical protein
MKKYFLSVALLIAICISAKAQFTLGVKGGINFSKIDADNVNKSSVTGYQAGAFARIGGGVYLQPELYLSSCGGDFDSNNNGTAYSAHVKFTNLNVPLLLGYRIGPKNLNLRLMAGPVYSYALNKDESFSNNFTNAYQDFGKYRNSTLGLQAGAGVDLGSITADLRYQAGLTNVNDNFNQKQNIWALSVGFKFF